MKQILTYIRLEYKRFFKLIPHIIIGTTALSLLAVLIAFCAGNILSPDTSDNYKVKVAFVIEDDSALMDMLADMLKNSDCISTSCELIDTDYETARQMVLNNEAAAALIIPEGFVESVQNGTNLPINVDFAENSTIIALILRQLSVAGAGTLSAAQAGIYTQYSIYKSYDFLPYDVEANEYLNDIYLKYVLQRGTMFHKTPASPTGNISIPEYYKCSGIALILILISISFSTFLCGFEPVFESFCSSKGISYPVRFFARLLVLSTFCAILLYIPFRSIVQVGIIIPAVICSNCISILIYKLCSSPSIGIFVVFIFNFISAFLSGYFIPVSFFPDIIQDLSAFLPASLIFKQIKYAINGGVAATLALLFISCIAFLGALLADRLKSKGGHIY